LSLEKEKESAGEIVDMKVLRQLYTFVKPYQKQFYFLVFLTIALAILAPTRPYLIQIAIDEHVALGDAAGLLQIIYVLVALMVIQAFAMGAHLLFGMVGPGNH